MCRKLMSRLAGLVLLGLGLGAGGCILPIPTVPLNLPAHGHTYGLHDRANRPMDANGILIVHTFYHYAEERLDCYPIRNGKADLPRVLDVRTQVRGMFGYFSLIVPTYFISFHNGHHAHVYPVVPGHGPNWDYSFPSINESHHIYGVLPRPEVFRMFPQTLYAEKEMLHEVAGEMRRYVQIENPSGNERHNAEQARLAMQYVCARLKELAKLDRSPFANQPYTKPTVPARKRINRYLLTSRQAAFRAIQAGDHATLKEELDRGLDPDSYDRWPWTLLNRAISLGDLKAVKSLVEHGADLNRKLPERADSWGSYGEDTNREEMRRRAEKSAGYTPMALAAGFGHLDILQYLQSKGAKVGGPGKGYTLMHAAADRFCDAMVGDGPGRREVIRYLVKQGHAINPNHKAVCCLLGGTPLDMARRNHKPRTAELLISLGGKTTKKKSAGKSENAEK